MRFKKEILETKGMILHLYHTARLIGDERMIGFYGELLEIYRKEGL